MPETFAERLSRDTASKLQQGLERLQQRLHEAECQTPPPVYQMIEALREVVREDSQAARGKLLAVLREIGTSEAEFLDWLQQDIERLERRLIQALGIAADPTQLDMARLRQSSDAE